MELIQKIGHIWERSPEIHAVPPAAHQRMIDVMMEGKQPENIVSIEEGHYVTVNDAAYAGNFITCPAVLIESLGMRPRCLHVTFDEFLETLEHSKFRSKIDFDTFREDVQSAEKITILLAARQHIGELNSILIDRLKVKFNDFAIDSTASIKYIPVNEIDFQLLITSKATSIWHEKHFLGNASP